ncbi:MAG: GNAT family N-acetyltransferase [Patescibacteria group bacterium]
MYEFPKEITLSDETVLRRWRKKDANALFALVDKNRNHLRRWLLWVDKTKTVTDSKRYIEKCINDYSKKTTFDMGIWHHGVLAGAIGFNAIDNESEKVSIGYWLTEELNGKGIITAAVKKLTAFAFNNLHMNRITILCDTQNTRSCRIPEKLGFTEEGLIQKDEKRYGKFYDYKVYTLLKKDQRHVIDVEKTFALTKKFASFIKRNKKNILSILTTYETRMVAEDEIKRTLDLLENLNENGNYFVKKTKKVVTFLPINQPLYTLTSFAIIPSLMAEEVFVRPPNIAWGMMNKLSKVISLDTYFPNIFISNQSRESFTEEHSTTHTDAVIFTGSSENALATQKKFGDEVLFIGNGSSHNPVVVTKEANIKNAVKGVAEVQLYNQGGDCAAPNAILVESAIFNQFLKELHRVLKRTKTGDYRKKETTVGPFLEKKHFLETMDSLKDMRAYLDPQAPGVSYPEKNLLEPTIILKPLDTGGNYKELFAPVFVIQRYKDDQDLKNYFENENYRKQAAYITVYGQSNFVDTLVDEDKILRSEQFHREDSIIRNTHLHAYGVERGTKPYGGYGTYSSFIAHKGKLISKPTLPQRDIFEYLIAYKGHSLQEIKDDITGSAESIFETDLEYIFLSGSVTYGGGVLGKSDLDAVLLFNDNLLLHNTKEQLFNKCLNFAQQYIRIHKKYGFSPDLLFPGEFLTRAMVNDALAGRGFAVRFNRLYLPQSSNQYYLTSEETWFRAWLSMLACSILLKGSEVNFKKIQRGAWKTIILFHIAQRAPMQVTPLEIAKIMVNNTDKSHGFGITKNYFLFEALELPTIKEAFEELSQEGYLVKKRKTYTVVIKKVASWENTLVKNISNKNIQQAPLIIDINDIKQISTETTNLFYEN